MPFSRLLSMKAILRQMAAHSCSLSQVSWSDGRQASFAERGAKGLLDDDFAENTAAEGVAVAILDRGVSQ